MNLQIFKLMKKNLTISNKNNSIYWDKSHCLFVNENLGINDIKEFINDYIYPEKKKLIVIKIYCENDTQINQIKDLYPDAELHDRILLKHDLKIIPESTQNNYYYLPKMNELIKRFENYDDVYSEVCSVWNSFKNFIDNGFGILYVKDNEIICWCLSEYNSQGYCGIGIETIEEYQNQKIGTNITIRFLQMCEQYNTIPYWDSWSWNEPSVKIAKKLGFKKVEEYKTFLLKL